MSDTILVIGGGIAGIQASLDLADAGARVILVEREATIGGVMAVLDKNFPTLDCSICIEAPKMSAVDLHPNIEILNLAEVVGLEGTPGDFLAHIRQKASFVTDECTRCGDCTLACPIVLPNEYDSGMAFRKAIYTPIPQSVPGNYVVDLQNCLNDPPNYIPCVRCSETCPPKAIDFFMPRERQFTRHVGAVIIAVGYDTFDPSRLPAYGYGQHPDILTALEFERLINSAGPTGGEILRPSDGRHPEKILFVLCVGSRDRRFYQHCSRFCCMYSIKHAYQALDHKIPDVTVLYMDIRAYGKGFDHFWQRTQEAGARFIRGRPARIEPFGNQLRATYFDTENARRVEENFDLIVLETAATPSAGLAALADNLRIEIDEDGFIKSQELEGALMMTTRPGVYSAGCVSGPKDIPDSVAEGSGSAALALRHLSSRYWAELPEIEPQPDIEIPRVGVFVCHCGSNIGGVVDVPAVVEYASTLPDVIFASDQLFSCAGNTQEEIVDAIHRHAINRVVVAACSPKTHETIFQGVLRRAGLNPYLLVLSNIRNLDSWVHKFDPEGATTKAKDMVWMTVEKARRLTPLESSHLPVTERALVIGGGIAGMTAASGLAGQGVDTHLVEKSECLGGLLTKLERIAPSSILARDLISEKSQDLAQSGVHIHLNTTVETIGGIVGNFQARLSDGQDLQIGTVLIATGADPYTPTGFDYWSDPGVITNLDLERLLTSGEIPQERITFLACIGSRQGRIGCSRYCCASMIQQAIQLRQMGKKVRVVSKDIRTYSRQAEEQYAAAMRAGVQFFRYTHDMSPEDTIQFQPGKVTFFDTLLGEYVQIQTDLLVLVVGLEPTQDSLAEQLKLARSEDGFYMELHPKLGPAETANQGIYLAGTAQGAKDVRETMAQALAASAKAGALLARGVIEKEPLTALVDLSLCTGCMRCVKVCPYHAIEQVGPIKEGHVRILSAACLGCGTCAAECNFDAIDMPYFTKEQILAQIDATLHQNPAEKCVVFTCNWCSYAGADLAGIEKRQYPSSARIIRTMCSARFEEDFVARCFENGAGAVLITGCRLTDTGSDCHYNYANRFTHKRFNYWRRKFRRLGITEERLQLQWVSAAEGKEFAAKIAEMDAIVKKYLPGQKESVPPS